MPPEGVVRKGEVSALVVAGEGVSAWPVLDSPLRGFGGGVCCCDKSIRSSKDREFELGFASRVLVFCRAGVFGDGLPAGFEGGGGGEA